MNIHPTAIVSPHARLGHNVRLGAYCIVEDGASVGDDCQIEARVSIKEGTHLGPSNWVCEGTILGGLPQHAHIPTDPGRVVIGAGNVFRENCTVHRALKESEATCVGDKNLFMAGTHIAHDCQLGSYIITANNALLGGHVTVQDRAYISGGVAIHQYCRIGGYVMIGGQARVVQDVPPFVTVDGQTGCVVGLNLIGIRRNKFDTNSINQLKAAYRILYRRNLNWNDILARLDAEFKNGPVRILHDFLCGGTRGFVQERRLPPGATLKLRQPDESATQGQPADRKAG